MSTSARDEKAMRTACAEFADIPDEEWRFFWAHLRAKEFAPRQHIVRVYAPDTEPQR